jgi:hypothetical protein
MHVTVEILIPRLIIHLILQREWIKIMKLVAKINLRLIFMEDLKKMIKKQ